MAVPEQTPIKAHTGNGVTTVFAFDFLVLDADDMLVLVDGATVSSALYTLAGVDVDDGGTVTFDTAPDSGAAVVLLRDSTVTRETDYQSNGDLLAAVINRDFDRLWLVLQEIVEGSKGSPRALRAPVGETVDDMPSAAERADMLLSFDSDGNPIAVAPADGTASSLAVDLASTTAGKGSKLVAFIQRVTGAVAQWVEDKLARRIDVIDFGADSTGVANCDTAFAAIKVRAQATGEPIRFTAGTYTYSATLALDWSRARVIFDGIVTLVYTGTGNAVSIDGGASGSLYDVRFGAKGHGPLIRCDNGTHGIYVRSLGHGEVYAEVLSAGTAALLVEFAVCCKFGIRCTENAQPGFNWVDTVPVNGLILNKRNTGELVADCIFDNCIIEHTSGTGITGNGIYRSTFLGGTSEGNGGGGYEETGESGGNLLQNFFCEANTGADFIINGGDLPTKLVNCSAVSTTAASSIARSSVIDGGQFSKLTITSGSIGTVLKGGVNILPGGFTDSGARTVYEGVHYFSANGAPIIPDLARRPKMKRVGAMTVTAATKASACAVTITNHRLDYGESITIASVGGMTQLNGNTYQVEPINETDSVYLLSGGAYVDSSAFGTYTSGGTATFVAFNSSWAVAGSSYRDPGFFRDQSGMVHLFGAIKGTSLSGVAAFTLPAGFRPSALLTYPAWELTPTAALVQITSAGVVTPSSYTDGANKVVSLDGISFLAEQ